MVMVVDKHVNYNQQHVMWKMIDENYCYYSMENFHLMQHLLDYYGQTLKHVNDRNPRNRLMTNIMKVVVAKKYMLRNSWNKLTKLKSDVSEMI